MDLMAALTHCGGAARREELLALGVPRRALARALSDFTIWRPQRGPYALPDAPRARVLAAAFRAHLTCVSALREWDVPLLRNAPRGVHLGLPRDRGVTDADPRCRPGLAWPGLAWPRCPAAEMADGGRYRDVVTPAAASSSMVRFAQPAIRLTLTK